MKKTFKTIIVGAGPGGLTAGKYLEDALILDQKEEIGKPVQCAEGLAKKYLDEEGIKPDPSWISATIDNTQVILPNGKKINYFKKGELYILDRVGFEKFLASQSKAKILLRKRVIDIGKENGFWEIKTKDGEVFRSEYLIGADGPFSIVRRKVFKEEIKIFPSIEYLVKLEREIDNSQIKIYFDKKRFFGYAWIFPKSKNTANVGLGGMDLKRRFEDLLENSVKKEYGNYQLLENKSGPVPWIDELINMVKDKAILVGDAAGLVDPISGGGVGNAMISGRLAAKSILSGNLDPYQSEIESLPYFKKDMFLAREILYSFNNETLNELGEVLEKMGGDVFYLKNFSALFGFLSKPNLRKNIFKFIRLLHIYHIYQKNVESQR